MSVDIELRDALTRIGDQVVGQGESTRVEVAELRGELRTALATIGGRLDVAASERLQLSGRLTSVEADMRAVNVRIDHVDDRVDGVHASTQVDRAKVIGFALGCAFAGGSLGAGLVQLFGG